MWMAVRFVGAITHASIGTVRVLVVLVVYVHVLVLQHLMHVLMLVPLGDVEPHTQRHERSADHERRRYGFTPEQECHCRTDERCG